MSVTPPRPPSFADSALYACGIFGANVVYAFLNLAAGLYLERYPQVPTWAVGLLSQERSLAGALVQPIVGAWSDRTRTRIGRRKPFFIGGVLLTWASLLFLAGFPPLVPMLIVLSINAFFLNVAVDPYYALMADLVPLEQRGRVGALLAVFNMGGQIVATVAGLFLWDRSPELVFVIVATVAGLFLWDRSPELVFVIVATVLVVSFAITTIFVHEPEAPPRPTEPVRLDVGAYVSGIFAHRELVKYILAASLFWLGTGGVLPYLTRFGVHVLGLSEGEAFQLFLPALGGTQVDSTPQALVVMGIVGLANGFWTALAIPLLIDLVPPERAAEMTGIGSAVWSFAQPIGAVVAGLLIDRFDTYRVSFIGAAIFVLISFALVLTVQAPRAVRTQGQAVAAQA